MHMLAANNRVVSEQKAKFFNLWLNDKWGDHITVFIYAKVSSFSSLIKLNKNKLTSLKSIVIQTTDLEILNCFLQVPYIHVYLNLFLFLFQADILYGVFQYKIDWGVRSTKSGDASLRILEAGRTWPHYIFWENCDTGFLAHKQNYLEGINSIMKRAIERVYSSHIQYH